MDQIELVKLESYDQIKEGDLIYGASTNIGPLFHSLVNVGVSNNHGKDRLGYRFYKKDELGDRPPFIACSRELMPGEETLGNLVLFRRRESTENKLTILAGEEAYKILSDLGLTAEEEARASRVSEQGTRAAIEL